MMYDLPADFDLEQLRGKSLDVISFGQFKVAFHFSGGYLIEVENDISLNSEQPTEFAPLLARLHSLINQEVSSVTRYHTNTLSLIFERNDVLNIYGSSKQYECYQISFKGDILAIV